MCEELSEFEEFGLSLRDEVLEHEVGMSDFTDSCILPSIKEEAETAFGAFQRQYRIPQLNGVGSPFHREHYPKVVHAIRSMVGDDETITTNSLLYAVLCVLVGPILARIKISWPDVQFNRELFNYAEGWILLPPSMDSSFEAVNKYNRGNGVPYVLDPIKFKDLSAVRKQSEMEHDLPSKFRNLAQKAAWTNPGWFTWDMHQLALLLGIEIFDFARSNIYPFLFQWEGGCGGAPPWNNLFTAAGSIFRYRSGRATKGILGVMNDANQLHTGAIRPSEALFAKNLNLALSGDARWFQIRNELEFRRKKASEAGLPYESEVRISADRTIPAELLAVSETVDPSDALTGVAVSHLRDKGYVTTELDLVSLIENQKRLSAVWGITPMRDIEDQIALRKQEYKEAFLETLSLLGTKERVDPTVYGAISELENPFSLNSLLIMERYYRMRIEQSSHFSSFIYNEEVRVFKTEDVERYFQKGVSSLRDAFCESVESLFRPDWRRSIQLPDERKSYDDIERWMSSKPLNELLAEPIPPGIGPDDARIVRDALESANSDRMSGYNGIMYLIVSSDKRLISSCQQVLSHDNPGLNVRVLGLNVIEFIAWSLSKRGRPFLAVGADAWLGGFELINPYYGHRREKPTGPLLDALRKEARYLFQSRKKKARVFYDLPNINRALKRFKLDPSSGLVTEMTGGFLSRSRAEADIALAARSIETIKDFDDFDYLRRRNIGPINRRMVRLFSASRQSETAGY